MMTAMDNTAKLYQIFADLFEVDTATLSDDTAKGELERWDSLGTLNLVAEMETVFGVHFELLEVTSLGSIGVIKEILSGKGVAF
jgi:acyl carrier protein